MSIFNRKRQPRGTTVGGQFATESKSESAVSLAAPRQIVSDDNFPGTVNHTLSLEESSAIFNELSDFEQKKLLEGPMGKVLTDAQSRGVPPEYAAQVILGGYNDAKGHASGTSARKGPFLDGGYTTATDLQTDALVRAYESGMPADFPQNIARIDKRKYSSSVQEWNAGLRLDGLQEAMESRGLSAHDLALAKVVMSDPEAFDRMRGMVESDPEVARVLGLRGWENSRHTSGVPEDSHDAARVARGWEDAVRVGSHLSDGTIAKAAELGVSHSMLHRNAFKGDEAMSDRLAQDERDMAISGLSHGDLDMMRTCNMTPEFVRAHKGMPPGAIRSVRGSHIILGKLDDSEESCARVARAYELAGSNGGLGYDSRNERAAYIVASGITDAAEYAQWSAPIEPDNKNVRYNGEHIDRMHNNLMILARDGHGVQESRAVVQAAGPYYYPMHYMNAGLHKPEVRAPYEAAMGEKVDGFHDKLADYVGVGGTPEHLRKMVRAGVDSYRWAELRNADNAALWKAGEHKRETSAGSGVSIGGVNFGAPAASPYASSVDDL